ncbi:flagellar hook-associated protein FlgK [Longimicrobium sp.]|uniref:flagellar hook-associated protein FlgK n=1 Tax=Longimicrobium sp. TaxID=2029185 RepID=UPI002E3285B6|nr:flagellar hook-associated protein FlgK [Longimicrobium sp.]HEX6039232.1 flagellar hook-associated protein FlgK [Longimicrobium sp.]
MSLGNILSVARSALLAQQTAVQVASQNLSNAATEGYSRQRAALAPGDAVRTAGGLLGTGVRVRNVERARDSLLDVAVRREGGNAAGAGLRRDLLGEVEGVFGELSGTPVAGALDEFWNAWSDLASHPDTDSLRGLVQLQGGRVATTINGALDALAQVGEAARDRVMATVSEVNNLAARVADLNGQIQTAELGGATAGDLRDSRDLLLDDLAKRSGARVLERPDGTLAVAIGGATIVDGTSTRALEVRTTAGTLSVGLVGSPSTVSGMGGEAAAALEVHNGEVPRVSDELRRLGAAVATEVNAVHRAGNGRDFFAVDASGRLSLSPDVANAANIGLSPGGRGDNRMALDLAALRDRAVPSLGGRTFTDAHAEIVAGVGHRLRAADQDTGVYETLQRQAESRRGSVSGVSTDEELVTLMRHQQAYAAAARLVTTVDEMMQAVLGMK